MEGGAVRQVRCMLQHRYPTLIALERRAMSGLAALQHLTKDAGDRC